MAGDDAGPRAAFADFYAALKPGGVLGVVDHRLPENADAAREKTAAISSARPCVRLATAAGFRLAGEVEINANPKDTRRLAGRRVDAAADLR